MGRRIARVIAAAAAAAAGAAAFGLTAAGAAGAATRPAPEVASHHAAWTAAAGPRPVTTNFAAGYGTALFENWKFRSVSAVVPVAACKVAPTKNPAALVQLFGGTTWTADISVFCNGGVGSLFYFDQKSAHTTAQGNFRLAPRLGDRVRVSINRNVAGHQDSFTVTDLRTGRSQTVRVTTSTAVVYHHAFLGAGVATNADVMPLPATRQLLWTFQNSHVVTYAGVGGTLRGPWSTVTVVDHTSGGATVMFPGVLPASGAGFSAFLHKA